MCSECSGSVVAGQAHRPPGPASNARVLHVLGDQPGDVHLALGPLLGPPLPGRPRRPRAPTPSAASPGGGPPGRRAPGLAPRGQPVVHVPILPLAWVRRSLHGSRSPTVTGMGKALLEVPCAPRRRLRCRRGRRRPAAPESARAELSPEPAAVVGRLSARATLPVFVQLRLTDSWTTTGGEMARLTGLAEDYLRCGAAGVSFGFLDADLEVDLQVCTGSGRGRCPASRGPSTAAFDDALEPRAPGPASSTCPAWWGPLRRLAARSRRRLRRPARPRHPVAADRGAAGHPGWRAAPVSTCPGSSGPASGTSTSAPRCVPAARTRPTSTPGTSAPGG